MRHNDKATKQSPQQKAFKLFMLGGIALLSGLATIVGSNIYIPPSMKQEIIMFLALIVSALGAIVTIFAYLKLLALRFKHFLDNDNPSGHNNDEPTNRS